MRTADLTLADMARDLALASPNLTPVEALELIQKAVLALTVTDAPYGPRVVMSLSEEWATLPAEPDGSYESGITRRSLAPHEGPARRRYVTEWEIVPPEVTP